MNEAAFKPLFRRLFDWAFTTSGMCRVMIQSPGLIVLPEAADARKSVFLHLYTALLDYFKVILTEITILINL